MVSAWYSSAASIKPDARALSRSIPFPCETATDRELGLQTMTTGIPIESNPVTFATRVIPITGARRSTRLSVSLRLADLCVPRRNAFSVPPINQMADRLRSVAALLSRIQRFRSSRQMLRLEFDQKAFLSRLPHWL